MPDETPTLLFTDIEGSTALFERVGAVFTTALALHHQVLRQAIQRHGGRVVRDTGDGLIAGFSDAAGGVAAAIAAQQALWTADWPLETGPLRVRMGLHRGPAEFRDGDYHGLAMHHAARVMSSAHGMQILCSSSIVEMLDGDSPATRDLGLYRLKGIVQPVRLFEILHSDEGYPRLPPPSVSAAFTHSLPVPLTRYFGRKAEIEELVRLLSPRSSPASPGRRLITILGPGGTGKTRLAIEVGHRLLPEYSHAIWFVPLADLREPELILDAVREALGLAPDPHKDSRTLVAQYLRAQPSLLLLDNLEQLLPDAADAIGELLTCAPTLACLVTSRRHVEIGSEEEYPLQPLRIPPAGVGAAAELGENAAAQLFLDRVRGVRRDFEITSSNVSEVALLLRALEGIPLAVELAAARIGVLTPAQMLQRMHQRLDVLSGNRRDLPQRHRTLRATIAWSYELLPVHLQSLFAQLSVFRGGWTLEAAEALAVASDSSPSPLIFDDLAELRASSLIVAEQSGKAMRFHMLEVLREFAAERLAASPHRHELEIRHCTYFSELVIGRAHLAEGDRFARIAADYENIRSILEGLHPAETRARLSLGLRKYWITRGMVSEAQYWSERLVGEVTDARVRASLEGDAGICAWRKGDLAKAREHFEASLKYWETSDDRARVAGILNNLGILAVDSGDFESAHTFYERALNLYRELEKPFELAALLSNIGSLALAEAKPESARKPLSEALSIQASIGDDMYRANTLHNLSTMHVMLGDPLLARQTFAQSLQVRTMLGGCEDETTCFSSLAEIADLEDRLELAAKLYGAALRAAELQEASSAEFRRHQLETAIGKVIERIGPAAFREHAALGRSLTLMEVLGPEGEWLVA